MKKTAQTISVKSAMSCGECEGLSRRALMVADDNGKSVNCSSMGKEADAKPCGKFRSDLLSLSVDERVALRQLINLVKKFDVKSLRVVAASLLTESKTREKGVRIGQRMFVRIRSTANRNYVGNFMSCVVLDARDDVIRLMSDDGKTTLTYQMPDSGEFNGPCLYTLSEFRPLLKQMRAQGHLIDPKAIPVARKFEPEEDVKFKAPRKGELASAVAYIDEIISNKSKAKRKKGKGASTSLVDFADLARQIDSGIAIGTHYDDDDSDAPDLTGGGYRRKVKKAKGKGKPAAKRPKKYSGVREIEITSI